MVPCLLYPIGLDQMLTLSYYGSVELLSHPNHFDPEDGGSMSLQNIGNTVHFHIAKISKSQININSEPL
jgi:hypothetical protein